MYTVFASIVLIVAMPSLWSEHGNYAVQRKHCGTPPSHSDEATLREGLLVSGARISVYVCVCVCVVVEYDADLDFVSIHRTHLLSQHLICARSYPVRAGWVCGGHPSEKTQRQPKHGSSWAMAHYPTKI